MDLFDFTASSSHDEENDQDNGVPGGPHDQQSVPETHGNRLGMHDQPPDPYDQPDPKMQYPAPESYLHQDPHIRIPDIGGHIPFNLPGNQKAPRTPTYHNHRVVPYKPARPRRTNDETSDTQNLTPNNPRARFLHDQPALEYILPEGGPLNFTIAEIISILPNWFRNRDLVTRFMNNGISAGIHFLILDTHRQLDLTTEMQRDRARDHISDAYRKAMRKIDPMWTKAKHQIPLGWNNRFLLVNHIVPEGVREVGWKHPPSIVFKTLASRLKKLPQGNDAGDLTRALIYAMNNQQDDELGNQVDFLFPDDLHVILDRIGRAQINLGQTDTYIIARYSEQLREAQQARYKEHADMRKQHQDAHARRNIHAVTQQGQYPIPQHLQSGFPMPIDPQLARHPFHTPINGPSGCNIYQHGQVNISQASPTSAPTIPRSNYGTGIPPLGMGVLVPGQMNLQENQSRPPPHFQPNLDLVYRSPYANPSPAQSGDRIAAAIVAWMEEQDRTAEAAAQREQNDVAKPHSWVQDASKPQPEIHNEEGLAMEPGAQRDDLPALEDDFFPPMPDVCRIPELEQIERDRALLDIAGPGYKLFSMEDMDAVSASFQFLDDNGVLMPPKDNSSSDEANDAPVVESTEPENVPHCEEAAGSDSVAVAPSTERLLNGVEGDDLTA